MWRWLLVSFLLITLSGCSQLLFHPTKPLILTPDKVGLSYQDHYFNSHDGTQLHGWWLPAEGEPKATVLYVHGNAQNISNHLGNVYWLPANNVNLLIFDYRGYGLSAGQPSLAGAISDIDSALEQALDLAGDTPMIVIAHSLGAAMSIHSLANSSHKTKLSGIILASSFSDYHQITRETLAKLWLTWPLQYPLSWTIDNDYSPITSVAKLAPVPQLYLHSPADPVISPQHSEALFNHALKPKQLALVKGGHNQIFLDKENRELVLETINGWSQPTSPSH